MTKLYLLQELMDSIDNNVDVEQSDDGYNWYYFANEVITVGDDNDNDLVKYILIDLGFKWYNYCSWEVFTFLHEVGHHINGNVDLSYNLLVEIIKTSENSFYDKNKMYILLDDEYYAWDWAYQFIKDNKRLVKRLSKELYAL